MAKAPQAPESPADDRFRDAARLARLVLHWKTWSHRRTETIAFIDDVHARRAHTVDFTITREGTIRFGRAILVPLALPAKRTLRNFDLRGSAGEALPMLTMPENVALGRAMLIASAASALQMTPEEAARQLDDVLDIVGSHATQAAAAVKELERGGGSAGAYGEKLKTGDVFYPLANDLARNFLMCSVLPIAGPRRRIAKFAYDEPLNREEFGDDAAVEAASDRRLRGRLAAAWEVVSSPRKIFSASGSRPMRLLRWLAIETVDFKFPAPYVSLSESYHVEIAAPDDLVIEHAALYKKVEKGTAADLDFLCDPVRSTDRAHLHARDLPRGTSGEILVRFRVRSSRILLAARNISWATTGLLAGGLVLHGLGVPSHAGVASLLLVALPGVYATYLARPGAHRLVQRLVSGVQATIGTQALLSFLAAASLAVGLSTSERVGIWGACLVVSTLGSLAMWLANRRATRIERGESLVAE